MARQIVATLGAFDGIHRGHRHLFAQLLDLAKQLDSPPAVITFAPHPAEVLYPDTAPPHLASALTNQRLIKTIVGDRLISLPFTLALSRMSAEDFLRYLRDEYSVGALLLGYDHQFGRGANQTFEDYCEIGERLGVGIYKGEALIEGEAPISSSRIRSLLSSKRLVEANALLGRPYEIEGEVVGGMRIGRLMGYPTANVQPLDDRLLLPTDGVYATRIGIGEHLYTGMLYIGKRPTLSGEHRTIEVNIFDFSANLYSKHIVLYLEAYIRGDMKMPSLEALQAQIAQDEMQIRQYFAQPTN